MFCCFCSIMYCKYPEQHLTYNIVSVNTVEGINVLSSNGILWAVKGSHFKKNVSVYLFLAVLGLRCAWAFSRCGEGRGWRSSSLQCEGFSLWWLLLFQSLGSRHTGSAVVTCRLQGTGSIVIVNGINCPMACGSFPDQGSNPCSLHQQVDS